MTNQQRNDAIDAGKPIDLGVPVDTLLPFDTLSIASIARVIRRNWKKVYFGAVPYLDAMCQMGTINDDYGLDSGVSIVLYFLANANTWRGPIAREVKKELNKRCKGASYNK